MLSEFELTHIERYADNFVGDQDVKAMAKRLLELNKEVKAERIEKENAIREKENAEEMVAEAAGKLVAAESEVQTMALEMGDLVEEKDALLEELKQYKKQGFCIKPSITPEMKEIIEKMKEAAMAQAAKGFDEEKSPQSMLITILSMKRKHD